MTQRLEFVLTKNQSVDWTNFQTMKTLQNITQTFQKILQTLKESFGEFEKKSLLMNFSFFVPINILPDTQIETVTGDKSARQD